MNQSVRIVLFAFIMMIWAHAEAEGCEKRRYVRPLPTGNDLMGVAFDGAQFWVVGDHGLVMTSPDGQQWDMFDVPTEKSFMIYHFRVTAWRWWAQRARSASSITHPGPHIRSAHPLLTCAR